MSRFRPARQQAACGVEWQQHHQPHKGSLADVHLAARPTRRSQGRRSCCGLQLTASAAGGGRGVSTPGSWRSSHFDARGWRVPDSRSLSSDGAGGDYSSAGRAAAGRFCTKHQPLRFGRYNADEPSPRGVRGRLDGGSAKDAGAAWTSVCHLGCTARSSNRSRRTYA